MLVLVDDNDLFRSALADNLREDGYQVVEYESGSAVPVDHLAGVDALLSEFLLASESGLQFARRFHTRYPAVPVVIISSAAEFLTDEVADLGYITVLPKPLDYEALAHVLHSIVPTNAARAQ